MEKEKIVITGGAGFIFSHVVDHFVEKGWKVMVIDNLSEGSHPELIPDWEAKGVIFVEMNVADPEVIDVVLGFNPTYVVHAAAYSDVDVSIQEPMAILSGNIMANINMFEAARLLPKLKKFIYVSTDEVYGECETRKTESDIIFPKNPYSCSKAVGSLLRLTYDNTYSVLRDKTAETRFCNVFGPRQDERKILGRIKKGDTIPVHNGGSGYREYIYVKNIPPAIELILLHGNRTYNVTMNDGYTVNELIKEAEEATGKKYKTKRGVRPGMDLKYQMDATRIRELGWKPDYSFQDGLIEYLND